MLFSAYALERNAMCAPGEVQTEAGINLMGKRQLGFEFISGAGRKLLFFSPPTLMRRLKRFLLNVPLFNSMLVCIHPFAMIERFTYKEKSESLIVFARNIFTA